MQPSVRSMPSSTDLQWRTRLIDWLIDRRHFSILSPFATVKINTLLLFARIFPDPIGYFRRSLLGYWHLCVTPPIILRVDIFSVQTHQGCLGIQPPGCRLHSDQVIVHSHGQHERADRFCAPIRTNVATMEPTDTQGQQYWTDRQFQYRRFFFRDPLSSTRGARRSLPTCPWPPIALPLSQSTTFQSLTLRQSSMLVDQTFDPFVWPVVESKRCHCVCACAITYRPFVR